MSARYIKIFIRTKMAIYKTKLHNIIIIYLKILNLKIILHIYIHIYILCRKNNISICPSSL